MLRLAAINAGGGLVFAAIYAAAGARLLTQAAFLAALVVFFGALTAIWVRAERSQKRDRDALSRIGRAGAGLLVVAIGLPGIVLVPLFALQEALPAEAGFQDVIRPVMVLLLISLTLVVALNVAGLGVLAGRALWVRLARRSDREP